MSRGATSCVFGLLWLAVLATPSACSSSETGAPDGGGLADSGAPESGAVDASLESGDDASSCKPGEARCGSACVDTRMSGDHCGGCGKACARDTYCSNSKCEQRRLLPKWEKDFGRDTQVFGEAVSISAIASDASERIVIAGVCTSSDVSPLGCTAISLGFDFGGGTKQGDSFVAAFDGAGARLWDRAFLGRGQPQLAVDASGNVYLAKFVSGTFDLGAGPRTVTSTAALAVVSYDASGAFRWEYVADGSGVAQPMAIGVGAVDQVVVGGFKSGDIDFGTGVDSGADGFLVALGPNGAVRWTRLLHPPTNKGEGYVRSVSLDPSGRVFVSIAAGSVDLGAGLKVLPAGFMLASFDSNGMLVWEALTTSGQAIVGIGSNETISGGTIEEMTRRGPSGNKTYAVASEQDTGCMGPTCPMMPFAVSKTFDEIWTVNAVSPKGALARRRKSDGLGIVDFLAFPDKTVSGVPWSQGPEKVTILASGDIVAAAHITVGSAALTKGRAGLARFERPTH